LAELYRPTRPTTLKSDDAASAVSPGSGINRTQSTGKSIAWYIGAGWNWQDPPGTSRSLTYKAAMDFALRTHRDLVDVVFPSFIHLNCTTASRAGWEIRSGSYADQGGLDTGLNFSVYQPMVDAGIAVHPTFEGDKACCSNASACPLVQFQDELATELLELALHYNLSGFTQDWEWVLTGSGFYWAGYNESMTHVADVLRPHGLGLGNSVSTDLDFVNFAHGSAPDCCPSYRNQAWASILTGKSLDLHLLASLPMRPPACSHDPCLRDRYGHIRTGMSRLDASDN
jgi:hypothetical protein